MRRPVFLRVLSFVLSLAIVAGVSLCASAQSNSGTVSGTVTDPSGAVVPGASVEINNHVTGYKRTAKTDASGKFRFYNVPFNPYRVTATMQGFGPATKCVDSSPAVPLVLPIKLGMVEAATTVTVEGGSDLIE